MDFKTAHLHWLKQTKNFVPFCPDYNHNHPVVLNQAMYYEMTEFTYSQSSCTQEYAKEQFLLDKQRYNDSILASKYIDKQLEKLTPTPSGVWFVTIGFNHQTWSVAKCKKFIEKVLAMDWIIRAKANFELYRENGEHPHCHFIIETKEPKCRILEKLLRPQYAKEVVFSKNFIDVKVCSDYHHKYINLDKQVDKMKYVEKDREWRKNNSIPEYEKNWN